VSQGEKLTLLFFGKKNKGSGQKENISHDCNPSGGLFSPLAETAAVDIKSTHNGGREQNDEENIHGSSDTGGRPDSIADEEKYPAGELYPWDRNRNQVVEKIREQLVGGNRAGKGDGVLRF
jgi:hypothetical protein